MPTYEYACAACGHEWEQTQRITEPPIDLCPVCDKSTAHRLISAGTNFILKGGGWYSDLYASPKPSSEASEKKSEGSEKKKETPDANGAASSVTPGESTTKPASTTTASTTSDTSSGTSGTSSGTSSVPST